MTEPLRAQLQVQLNWDRSRVDDLPVFAASHFIVQGAVTDPTGFKDIVLTVGYLPPPVFGGTPEEQRQAVEALDQVTVRPIARFVMPVDRAAELAQLLQTMVETAQGKAQES